MAWVKLKNPNKCFHMSDVALYLIYFLGLQSIDEPKEEEVNSCVSNMQK